MVINAKRRKNCYFSNIRKQRINSNKKRRKKKQSAFCFYFCGHGGGGQRSIINEVTSASVFGSLASRRARAKGAWNHHRKRIKNIGWSFSTDFPSPSQERDPWIIYDYFPLFPGSALEPLPLPAWCHWWLRSIYSMDSSSNRGSLPSICRLLLLLMLCH